LKNQIVPELAHNQLTESLCRASSDNGGHPVPIVVVEQGIKMGNLTDCNAIYGLDRDVAVPAKWERDEGCEDFFSCAKCPRIMCQFEPEEVQTEVMSRLFRDGVSLNDLAFDFWLTPGQVWKRVKQ
tara:strand:+ start:1698 stop:2075 length:378 start_codon:yes stop_codon:yes gene_type:complete